jgi:hypothetical protein
VSDRTIDITVTEATAYDIWRGLSDRREAAREELAKRRSSYNRATRPAQRNAYEHALSEQVDLVDSLTEQIEAIEQAVANGPFRIHLESVWSIAMGWPVDRILDADWERHYPLVHLAQRDGKVVMLFDEVLECGEELAEGFADGDYRGLYRIPEGHPTLAGQWHYCDLEDGADAIIRADHWREVLVQMNDQIAAKRAAKNGGAK